MHPQDAACFMSQIVHCADIRVSLSEHAAGGRDLITRFPASTLSVELMPIERASWQVDGGPTRSGRIIAGTTSLRAGSEVVWLDWAQPCKCIHIELSGALLGRLARQAGLRVHGLDYREGVYDPLVLHCALAVLEDARNGGRAGELYAQSVATTLAVHTLSKYGGMALELAKTPVAMSAVRLLRAKDYIETHLAQPLLLEQIAEAAALSTYYFARNFKALTGVSPHRYVTQRRIELAKKLLGSTRRPIAEVARQVGMPNQSHFATHFRALVGCTPSEFRRRA